jgi:3',5'-cyclic AMP phosphodiesterase CpdA
MSNCRPLIAAILMLAFRPAWAGAPDPTKDGAAAFVVKPYLQIGHAASRDALVLLWQTPDADADWSVEYQAGAGRGWTKAGSVTQRTVDLPGVEPHRVYRAELAGLEPGGAFGYRVRKGDAVVFSAEGRAPNAAEQAYRFVAFGDCGAGTPEQKPIAYQAFLARPDFVVIPGDIVYERGRVAEYRNYFWPVYNADEPAPDRGAPLLRSTLFLAAPGNHDTDTRDPEKMGGNLAYFYYWDQPLNGPIGPEGGAFVPTLDLPEAFRKGLQRAAGEAYPRMANFSFDYGNAHWTVVDSNPYVDWTDGELIDWIARDLAAAQGATWRFVAFHHPGFNSAREHYEQQQMRLLARTLEAGKVDIAFSGHVHNYQRSYPMRFVPDRGSIPLVAKDGKTMRGRLATGRWFLDKSFDGKTDTTPEGVIYVVTGAGGQHLYNPEQQEDRDSWQGFTHKFVSTVHSLTVADVDGRTLTVRQISADGTELDRFVVTK